MVLARAGLARLDRLDAVTELLDPLQMLPAPGAGRARRRVPRRRRGAGRRSSAALDHADSRAAVAAERSAARRARGGLHRPGRRPGRGRARRRRPRDLPPRLGDRGRRLRRRPAVRHRAGYRSRGDRTAARRRADRRRCRLDSWGARHEPRAQDDRPHHLRRGRTRRPGPAHGPGRRGAAHRAAWSSSTPTSRPRWPSWPARPPRCGRRSATRTAVAGTLVGRGPVRARRWSGWSPATRCPPTRWSARRSASPPPACRSTWCPGSPAATGVPAYAGVPVGSAHTDAATRATRSTGRRRRAAPGTLRAHRDPGAPRQDRRRAAGAGPARRHPGERDRRRHRRRRSARSARTLAALEADAAGLTGPLVVTVGAAVDRAGPAVLVGEPAAVRLEGAGAAHQGAGRRDERAAAGVRGGAGRGADDRGRAAAHARRRWSGRSRAWSPAGTSGSSSPRPTRCGRCGRSSTSSGWTRGPSPASRSPASVSRPRTRCAPSASSRS